MAVTSRLNRLGFVLVFEGWRRSSQLHPLARLLLLAYAVNAIRTELNRSWSLRKRYVRLMINFDVAFTGPGDASLKCSWVLSELNITRRVFAVYQAMVIPKNLTKNP